MELETSGGLGPMSHSVVLGQIRRREASFGLLPRGSQLEAPSGSLSDWRSTLLDGT